MRIAYFALAFSIVVLGVVITLADDLGRAAYSPDDAVPTYVLDPEAPEWQVQTWFNDPRALVLGDTVVVGFTDGVGRVGVEHRPLGGGRVRRVVVGSINPLLCDSTSSGERSWPRVDDHANPALAHHDGHLVVAFAEHTGRLVVAAPSDSSRTWTSTTLGRAHSYAHLVPNGDSLYLFSRRTVAQGFDTEATQVVLASGDGGRTWGRERTLFSTPGHRPYLKAAPGRGAVHLAVTDGHPDYYPTSLLYARLDGGDRSAPETVWSYARTGQRAWVWDVAEFEGRPWVAFVTFSDSRAPSDTSAVDDHGEATYRVAVRTERGWSVSTVTDAGRRLVESQPGYMGGITLVGPGDVVVSRRGLGHPSLYRYRLEDTEWQRQRIGRRGFRPYVVRDTAGRPRALQWVNGGYEAWWRFETSIDVETL